MNLLSEKRKIIIAVWEIGNSGIHQNIQAIAQSPILGTTITLYRLKKRGYKPML